MNLTNPGVRLPPPILFILGFVGGWLLHRYILQLTILPDAATQAILAFRYGGIAFVIAGFGLAVWGVATFRRAGTAIVPRLPASSLVMAGPYRYTRNPMYAGLTIAYLGGGAILNSFWPFLLLPAVLLALTHMVIHREERYLTDAFGSEYAEYQRRVGRWM